MRYFQSLITRARDDERAFTLVELMVVILIIAILIGAAIPTFLGLRNRAHDSAAQQDLRNTLTAAKAAAVDYEGSYAEMGDAALLSSLIEIEPAIDFLALTDYDEADTEHVFVGVDGSRFVGARVSQSTRVFCAVDGPDASFIGEAHDPSAPADCTPLKGEAEETTATTSSTTTTSTTSTTTTSTTTTTTTVPWEGVIAADDFDSYPDNTPLTDTTTQIGGYEWTSSDPSGNQMFIADGKLRGGGGTLNTYRHAWINLPQGDNYAIESEVALGASTIYLAGVVVRVDPDRDPDNISHWRIYLQRGSSNSPYAYLYMHRYKDGELAFSKSVKDVASASGAVLRVEVRGDEIQVFVDGVLRYTLTDDLFDPAVHTGVGLVASASGAPIDYFKVEALD